MRQGIFGGSFDPIHLGHVNLALEIMNAWSLDSVRFIPAANPPHKLGSVQASAAHRVAMITTAIVDHDGFVVDSRELDRGGTSYTVETIRELQREHPDDAHFFIIGADSLADLHKWYRIEDLAQMVTFLVAARPGDDIEEAALLGAAVPGMQFEVVPTTLHDLSSSEIREAIQAGQSNPMGLNDRVSAYIRKHGLYR
jgi:nicotinate-nucleotide adenylyltransferase